MHKDHEMRAVRDPQNARFPPNRELRRMGRKNGDAQPPLSAINFRINCSPRVFLKS